MNTAEAFGPALAGVASRLVGGDGRVVPAAVARWHGRARGEDGWLLDRCTGPTVDLGCGPGRLVIALLERDVPTLGVDSSRWAVRQCQDRSAAVLHRDVFAPLPGEGRWHHALLADGNIGIGGDPVRLLRRCAELLRPGGSVLVETEAPGSGVWRGAARLHDADGGAPAGPWFPWAMVGLDALAALGAVAGLHAGEGHRGERCFAELWRPVGAVLPGGA